MPALVPLKYQTDWDSRDQWAQRHLRPAVENHVERYGWCEPDFAFLFGDRFKFGKVIFYLRDFPQVHVLEEEYILHNEGQSGTAEFVFTEGAHWSAVDASETLTPKHLPADFYTSPVSDVSMFSTCLSVF